MSLLRSGNKASKKLKLEETNGRKIRKYRRFHQGFLIGSLVAGLYAGSNLLNFHNFDKNVTKYIEIAANAPSAGSSSATSLSMESALTDARRNTPISKLRNPAIIWKTPLTDTDVLDDLLDRAVTRSREIEHLKNGLREGRVGEIYPKLRASVDSSLAETVEQLAQSEYGLRIASEYEALNRVVGGGTRTTGKNLKELNKSLIETLKRAGGIRAIVRGEADDYKTAYADVFIGYLMANMGDLETGLKYFYKAKAFMDAYPDDKNMSLIRATPELSQRTLKGLINSSIRELETLNKDPSKYSAGWWKRLTYYDESIGGQANPSIHDVAETISGRYWARFQYSGILALGLFYIAGKFGKKVRLAKQYEVKTEAR